MLIRNLEDKIQGLILIENAVSKEEEDHLIEQVNKQIWSGLGIGYNNTMILRIKILMKHRPNPELKRRTQQYGHLFSYRYR